jgi:hypothetical protein
MIGLSFNNPSKGCDRKVFIILILDLQPCSKRGSGLLFMDGI